ncbi:dehydrogenase [Arthrobacter sp. AQ5-05]|uniref:SDR family NAD(P)-dependent oxidoreductase n=1 Tax=Arthrobacter sp. AQ5-05 TaxID=2184581 RepID=UPI000DCF2324|nr:SDR family oxidoreductase [Arthrobacter sp. AQ5-05]RAX48040.1 dehydrogenase [Arthrobacter sp. AQ5-05]
MTHRPDKSGESRGIALVTGGSGGIGSAVVRRLVADGQKVAFTYRNNAPSELLTDLGEQVEAHQLTLSDLVAAEKLIGGLLDRHGSIHTLIHAAGPHVPMVHLSHVTPDQFAEQVNADLVGFFNIVHAALPALRSSTGSIVAVTSAATSRYPKRDGLSAIPKGGVEAMVRALAVEEGRYGVRANCVGPGMLNDGMAARLIAAGDLDERSLAITSSNIPLGRFGTSHDIAEAVAFLASDRADFISGQNLNVDGGYSV